LVYEVPNRIINYLLDIGELA